MADVIESFRERHCDNVGIVALLDMHDQLKVAGFDSVVLYNNKGPYSFGGSKEKSFGELNWHVRILRDVLELSITISGVRSQFNPNHYQDFGRLTFSYDLNQPGYAVRMIEKLRQRTAMFMASDSDTVGQVLKP